MFRPATRLRTQRPLRRAILLGAALFLLWIATRYLVPDRTPPDGVRGNDAGRSETIASGNRSTTARPGYVLAFLILAGGGAYAWYLRKKDGSPSSGGSPLQTIGRIQLGPGQQVHLVTCGDEILVLGSTASNVTLLKSMPAGNMAAPVQAVDASNGERRPGDHAFARALERVGLPHPVPAQRG